MECAAMCNAACVETAESAGCAVCERSDGAAREETGLDRSEAAAAEFARALAFAGNSFLAPMSQTSDAALDRTFWAAFPDFGSEEAACALDGLFAWAAEGENVPRAERVRAVSVEYARLFIGPPEPAVAPWESFYVQEGVTNGFGEPTFRMRERLRQAALEVSNENNQYADHVGIELLYGSALAQRAAADGLAKAGEAALLKSFVEADLAPWFEQFAAALHEAGATYYGLLADLVGGLLGVVRAVSPDALTPAA